MRGSKLTADGVCAELTRACHQHGVCGHHGDQARGGEFRRSTGNSDPAQTGPAVFHLEPHGDLRCVGAQFSVDVAGRRVTKFGYPLARPTAARGCTLCPRTVTEGPLKINGREPNLYGPAQ